MMHPPDSLEDARDRLVSASQALSTLISEAQARDHQPEIDRLTAKREGVWVALSYIEEALRVAEQRTRQDAKS